MEKRTRSAGTKLTEGEYERLERAAEARGLKLGEWVRQVLLGKLVTVRQSTFPRFPPEERACLRTRLSCECVRI